MPAEITIKRDQWENNVTPLSANNLNVMLNQIVDNRDDIALRAKTSEVNTKIQELSDSFTGQLEDYATDAEAKGYADAKDEEIQHAKDLAEDAQTAADDAQATADDLAEYVGTFTTSEGVDTVVKYIDAENTFRTDIETVNSLGGINAGEDLDGMSIQQILTKLLYPYVKFVLGSTSRTAAAATLENGASQILSSASIDITKKSKPITSVKLFTGERTLEKTGNEVAEGGIITFDNLNIDVSKSNNPNLEFTVTDGETSESKNVGASTFVYPYYTGKCAANAIIDETLIKGLNKRVETQGNKTVTYTYANERMIFAYPESYGTLKSILDPNSFETLGSYILNKVSITGRDGTAQMYNVYVSDAAFTTDGAFTVKCIIW